MNWMEEKPRTVFVHLCPLEYFNSSKFHQSSGASAVNRQKASNAVQIRGLKIYTLALCDTVRDHHTEYKREKKLKIPIKYI